MSNVLSVTCRSILGALSDPAHTHRYPAVLPGAGSGSAHPQGQHRGVELHQPPAGGHRLRQLCGESVSVGGGVVSVGDSVAKQLVLCIN